MSTLRGLLFNTGDRNERAKKELEKVAKDYPVVAEILLGSEATKDQPAVPGGTISFWVHDGKIRCSVSVKSQGKTFFLDVADATSPWASVQLAIEMGEFGEKNEPVRASTNGEAPY